MVTKLRKGLGFIEVFLNGYVDQSHVWSYWSPIGCLPGWWIGERLPDMEGTGEIKYPGQTKTSTAALRLTEGSVKARGRKP